MITAFEARKIIQKFPIAYSMVETLFAEFESVLRYELDRGRSEVMYRKLPSWMRLSDGERSEFRKVIRENGFFIGETLIIVPDVKE